MFLRKLTDPLDEYRIPPESRYRKRVDGRIDETYRINFLRPLQAPELRRVIGSLIQVWDEGADVGTVALTKVEFIEPDTLEYRYVGEGKGSGRLDRMIELWWQIHHIHPIRSVDGIPYPWLSPKAQERPPGAGQAEG